jgi:hypothetical protein
MLAYFPAKLRRIGSDQLIDPRALPGRKRALTLARALRRADIVIVVVGIVVVVVIRRVRLVLIGRKSRLRRD